MLDYRRTQICPHLVVALAGLIHLVLLVPILSGQTTTAGNPETRCIIVEFFVATDEPTCQLAEEALQIEQACLLDDPTQWHLHEQIEKYSQAIAAE